MFTPRPHGLALGFGQHQEAPHAFPVPHRAALPSRTPATCQPAERALHLTIPVTDRDVTREYMAEYHPAENDV